MFVNYGDYDFFECGRLVDADHSDTEFEILYCEPYSDMEDHYIFAKLYVDITEDWIDKKAVCDFIGIDKPEDDPIEFALGCIDYYPIENFGAGDSMVYYDWSDMNKESIKEYLKTELIASDNLKIEW